MKNEFELAELTYKSVSARRSILRMTSMGGSFVGAALSSVDIILYLYNNYMNWSINPDELNKDYFILSKGHAVPALYSVFAETGIIEKSRLNNHLKSNDHIYWHPNVKIPAVDFHTGSLGHGLPLAVGLAIDLKISGSSNKVFVMTGDGELNEGTNWEAMLIASAKKLDNLVLIIDRNKFQANQETENLIPLEPIVDKLVSFGLSTRVINGHDFTDIHKNFNGLPFTTDKPSAIIANTVRGKGLPSLENKWDKWYCNFDDKQYMELITELENNNLNGIK